MPATSSSTCSAPRFASTTTSRRCGAKASESRPSCRPDPRLAARQCMRVHLIAVGRLKSGPHEALARHYAERLTFPLILRDVEEKRPLPPAELKAREGSLL